MKRLQKPRKIDQYGSKYYPPTRVRVLHKSGFFWVKLVSVFSVFWGFLVLTVVTKDWRAMFCCILKPHCTFGPVAYVAGRSKQDIAKESTRSLQWRFFSVVLKRNQDI
jgi:hypothetical protein